MKYRNLSFSAVLQRSPMALGNGTHKLPVRADVRKAIGRDAGDEVRVRLVERLS